MTVQDAHPPAVDKELAQPPTRPEASPVAVDTPAMLPTTAYVPRSSKSLGKLPASAYTPKMTAPRSYLPGPSKLRRKPTDLDYTSQKIAPKSYLPESSKPQGEASAVYPSSETSTPSSYLSGSSMFEGIQPAIGDSSETSPSTSYLSRSSRSNGKSSAIGYFAGTSASAPCLAGSSKSQDRPPAIGYTPETSLLPSFFEGTSNTRGKSSILGYAPVSYLPGPSKIPPCTRERISSPPHSGESYKSPTYIPGLSRPSGKLPALGYKPEKAPPVVCSRRTNGSSERAPDLKHTPEMSPSLADASEENLTPAYSSKTKRSLEKAPALMHIAEDKPLLPSSRKPSRSIGKSPALDYTPDESLLLATQRRTNRSVVKSPALDYSLELSPVTYSPEENLPLTYQKKTNASPEKPTSLPYTPEESPPLTTSRRTNRSLENPVVLACTPESPPLKYTQEKILSLADPATRTKSPVKTLEPVYSQPRADSPTLPAAEYCLSAYSSSAAIRSTRKSRRVSKLPTATHPSAVGPRVLNESSLNESLLEQFPVPGKFLAQRSRRVTFGDSQTIAGSPNQLPSLTDESSSANEDSSVERLTAVNTLINRSQKVSRSSYSGSPVFAKSSEGRTRATNEIVHHDPQALTKSSVESHRAPRVFPVNGISSEKSSSERSPSDKPPSDCSSSNESSLDKSQSVKSPARDFLAKETLPLKSPAKTSVIRNSSVLGIPGSDKSPINNTHVSNKPLPERCLAFDKHRANRALVFETYPLNKPRPADKTQTFNERLDIAEYPAVKGLIPTGDYQADHEYLNTNQPLPTKKPLPSNGPLANKKNPLRKPLAAGTSPRTKKLSYINNTAKPFLKGASLVAANESLGLTGAATYSLASTEFPELLPANRCSLANDEPQELLPKTTYAPAADDPKELLPATKYSPVFNESLGRLPVVKSSQAIQRTPATAPSIFSSAGVNGDPEVLPTMAYSQITQDSSFILPSNLYNPAVESSSATSCATVSASASQDLPANLGPATYARAVPSSLVAQPMPSASVSQRTPMTLPTSAHASVPKITPVALPAVVHAPVVRSTPIILPTANKRSAPTVPTTLQMAAAASTTTRPPATLPTTSRHSAIPRMSANIPKSAGASTPTRLPISLPMAVHAPVRGRVVAGTLAEVDENKHQTNSQYRSSIVPNGALGKLSHSGATRDSSRLGFSRTSLQNKEIQPRALGWLGGKRYTSRMKRPPRERESVSRIKSVLPASSKPVGKLSPASSLKKAVSSFFHSDSWGKMLPPGLAEIKVLSEQCSSARLNPRMPGAAYDADFTQQVWRPSDRTGLSKHPAIKRDARLLSTKRRTALSTPVHSDATCNERLGRVSRPEDAYLMVEEDTDTVDKICGSKSAWSNNGGTGHERSAQESRPSLSSSRLRSYNETNSRCESKIDTQANTPRVERVVEGLFF